MRETLRKSWFKFLTVGVSSILAAAAMLGTATSAAPDSLGLNAGAPLDLGIVNTDRLIASLVKQGIIPQGLDPEAQEQKLHEYLQGRVQNAQMRSEKSTPASEAQAVRRQAGVHVQTPVEPARPEPWNGTTRVDKILALLIEYPDLPHNNIQPGETDMYYDEYPLEHFQQMLFSDNGYTGPNGENLISMRQYYLQQSGGSYTVEGQVYGWYMAPRPAAYYGGNVPTPDGSDANPRSLVAAALRAAVANGVNLSEYDLQDPFDLDADNDYREPDGIVDHLMVLHAGVGEEAGGGSLGGDAIWSHSWNLGGVYPVPGSSTDVPYWGGLMGAYAYTVEPEDGAAGVFAHEFGHDLGLPDEYDTIYSGGGEPIEYYSIMSAGSWAGLVPGTEPSGFSPFAKMLFQESMGGNWQIGQTVNFTDIPREGLTFTLDQASTHGTNNDVVRINLPNQVHTLNTPAVGSYEYYGGKGDEIDHTMVTTLDLSGATAATLDYDTWYDIEPNWDFAFVQISADNGATWQSLSTSHTSSDIVPEGYPAIIENLPGYTGNSGGWMHETVDLSAYAGKQVQLQFRYMTDWGTNLNGFFVDNVQVKTNNGVILADGAEGPLTFALDGFIKSDGKYTTPHAYLVEWRTHAGVDQGLAHIKRGFSVLSNDVGMLVWYVNGAYDNNWVGMHPGYGYLGLVDAHQNVHHWGGNVAQGALASTRYQIYDAAFSLQKGGALDIDYGQGQHLYNAAKNPVPTFNDKTNYWSPSTPFSGLKLPSYGLTITVVGEASDRSAATIKISK